MGTQSQGRAGSPSFPELMQRSGNGREAVRRAVSLCVESLESRWLFAAVTTDKPDYNFGETALISGSEFTAGETVQLQVTHADGTPGSNDDPQNQAWQVQADAGGNIAATWLVNDPDATGATYILTATGLTSGDVATATFTDSRTINSVTLNGGTSVTVAPGASISANVNVTTDNGGGNSNWRSTGWLISTTPPGTVNIVDHTNHDGIGSYSETFSITAPATPGTYNAYFIAYSNDAGTNQPSATFVLAGSVVVNGAPVITLPGGPLTYTENAAPAIVDAGATATDSDSPDFNTGTLTVDYTANGTVDDRLAIRNQGTGAGQIGVSGSNVTFGGTTIGTFTGGSGTTPLVVTFNASSSPAAAQALMRNITFANVSDNPSTAARTVRFVLTDGDGGASNAATKTINVTAVNDAPVVAADDATVTVNEGQTANNTGTYADVDSAAVTISASVGTVTKTGTNSGTWSWSLGTTDGPNQSQTVTITANDGNGGITTTTFSLTVNNVAPTIAISGAASVNEGSSYSLTLGAVTDPGTDIVTSYIVHWGDGNSDTYASNGAKSHTYADGPNSRSITVDLVDEDGTHLDRANALSVTVNNVAPSIAITGAASVNEGSAYSLTLGAVTDPGTDSVSSYVVHWGDGNSDTYAANGAKSHTYADGPNTYNITVDLVDEDGTYLDRANALSVTVNNVAPVVTAPADQSANEGQNKSFSLGSFTDPAGVSDQPYVIDVNWGDGSTNTTFNLAAPGSLGSKNHTYADDGAYTVTVTVTEDGGTGAAGSTTFAANIDNVAPTIAISGAANVNEGSAYSLTLGAVTDPGTDTVSSYIVHWGDGNSDTYASNGAKSHTYADGPNTYDVTVDLVDEDATHLDTANDLGVTVNNVAPTIAITGAASVNEGSAYSLTLGAVTDPGDDTVSSYVVHWGDGNSSTYTSNGAKSHTYADGPNSYNITVDLTDEEGTYLDRANALGVTVNNVAPTIAISGAANVDEGSSYSLTLGAVTDPGADTVSSYVVHWGDGASDTYAANGVKTHTYADGPNGYNITVDLTDEDGTFLDRANALGVTVNNVDPTIAISGAASVNEGSAYSLTLGAVTDPGDDTVSSYIVHWGDGSSDTYANNGAKSHTYADGPNSYNVTLDLVDEDGTHLDAANALGVTVNNVPPSIAISGGAPSVSEGSAYGLTLGAVTDPGADTVTSYIIHWGDGNSNTYAGNGLKTHIYADGPNTYGITVDLVDEDGTHLDRANPLGVTVDNVAPTIAISGAASVNEGSAYSLTLGAVTDPGDDTVTSYVVHWGDGNSDTYGNAGAKNHAYADGPNSYNITVDLVDEDGTFLNRGNALGVTVNNVAPTIAISGAANVDEGSSYSLTLGAVTDPGDDTVSSYVVHWGDGASDTFTSNGVKTHAYADGPNNYNITVDLTDEDGTFLDRANAQAVTVDNVAPSIAISGAANTNEGSSYALTLGAVTDPGTDTVSSYIVHWGDGSSDTYGSNGVKNHTYADGPNSYNVTVDLVDEDGTHLDAANALGVTVKNVAPTIAITGAASANEGSAYTLNLGAVTDPGTDTISSYLVHWGDGSTSTYASNGNVTHSYADGPNSYNITVDLTDEDGTFLDRANAQSVTVNNVAPTIAISGAASADEGSAYSLTLGAVTDPGTDTVSSYIVHWGDGSSDTYAANGVKTHAYADGPNAYDITVDLTDEDGTFLDRANAMAVTVNNVDPTATANAYTLNEDGSKSGNVITDDTGSGADSDPAGLNDPLTVTAVNGSSAAVGSAVSTAHGTVTVNANGTFSYAPAANYFGADSFTYTISDGDGGTSTATISFTVNEVNDAPDALNDAGSTAQDTPYTDNVLTNDTDPDNTDGVTGNEDTLLVTAHSNPGHGTLTIGANGAYTYTPNLGYSGTDSFTYTISDGRGGTDTATVNINVGAAAANSLYLRNDDCFGGTMLIVNGSGSADNINISPASGGGVQVTIGGVLKGTYYPTGRIVVFGYGGDDQIIVAGSVMNPTWLYGDAGNDQLNLGNGGGIVFGGDGNDQINGGSGADILIGGQGGDRIVGNPGDDILCAGYTKYDNRFSSTYAHEDAWCHLYHEWARTDLATTSVPGDSSYTSFEQRIDHLTGANPGGHNGSYVLNNTTVDDDDDYDQIDMLTGSSGDDWFLWTKGEDKVNGISAAEGLEDLDTIS